MKDTLEKKEEVIKEPEEIVEKVIDSVTIKYKSKDYNRKQYKIEETTFVIAWVVLLLAWLGIGLWISIWLESNKDTSIFVSIALEFTFTAIGFASLIFYSSKIHHKNKIPQYNLIDTLVDADSIEVGYFNQVLRFIIYYKGCNPVRRSAEGLLTDGRMSYEMNETQVKDKSKALNVVLDFTDNVTKVTVKNKDTEEETTVDSNEKAKFTSKANCETLETTVNGVSFKIEVYDNKCTQIKVTGAASVNVE